MPPSIEISELLYERLGKLAKAFDQPADVIERLLDERDRATSPNSQFIQKSGLQETVPRPAATGHYENHLSYLGQAFKSVFGVNPRPFGQKSSPLCGFSDDAKGVQWNVALNIKNGASFLGVNLEGMKYRDWPIARLLLKEKKEPSLPELSSISDSDCIYVYFHRDAWQCASRPEIKEKELSGSGTLLSKLDSNIWLNMVDEALTCLDKDQNYLGRTIQIVTLAKSDQQEEKEVSPHLNIRTPLWSTPPLDSNEVVSLIQSAKKRLIPVYHRIRELAFEGDNSVFSETVDPESLKPDQLSPNHTNPRSYGVYKILSSSVKKQFRSGNHPIRQKELSKEFADVELIALYLRKELALERARIENEGG